MKKQPKKPLTFGEMLRESKRVKFILYSGAGSFAALFLSGLLGQDSEAAKFTAGIAAIGLLIFFLGVIVILFMYLALIFGGTMIASAKDIASAHKKLTTFDEEK
jgi:hypothetical protein